MKPSYKKSGFNYLPVIIHNPNKIETIYGPPLATAKEALKYAELAIRDRRIK